MTLKNTDENAIITIKAKQTADDGESESTSVITRGRFAQNNGKYYIFYDENESMGMQDSKVMITSCEDKVIMRRTGQYELKLTYCQGETESVVYYMPFGELNITQTTKKLKNSINESGGLIEIEYELEIGTSVQQNELIIKVERNDL